MRPSVKYWIFLSVIIATVFAVIIGSLEGAWYSLNEAEQTSLAHLFDKLIPFPMLGALILCAVIGFLVSLLFHNYIIPILKLAESTQLISAVNPEHRIQITKGAKEIHYLTGIINQSAEAFAKLQTEVDLKINNAQAKLKEERTRLAALMSELPNGVLVCNTDGQILLYNQQAQQLFKNTQQNSSEESNSGGIIGLGRSVFSILDRDPIVHALEMLHKGFESGHSKLANNFMMTLHNGLYLRVNMAPVFLEQEQNKIISGFVLAMEDMTNQIEADTRRDMLIQSLTDDQQAALQEIRNSITTILTDPKLAPEQLHSYRLSIDRASQLLQEKIIQARANYTSHLRSLKKTENVLADNLLEVISNNITSRHSIKVSSQATEGIWLQLDSYTMVQAVMQLVGMVLSRCYVHELFLTVTVNEQNEAELVVSWPDVFASPQLLTDWKQTPYTSDAKGRVLTYSDVIGQMSGAVVGLSHSDDACNGALFILPQDEQDLHMAMQVGLEHRPVSYEFDLFNRADWQELSQIPLNKLTYVVFDTETTGLNPSEGDEIIQIGAIRIVNGQMLYHETIDQLVDPQRYVPETSVAIHGIQPELLVGQPTIDMVLPHFHQYTENSVLVAHNAAFDMRFLELKEESTGIRFDNPVLDTLLLSSVVHPNQDSHSLEGLAERLNVTIVGRHTALGDAIVTGEVLLKLLPLLKAKGINTLAEALRAAAKSPFAKFNY